MSRYEYPPLYSSCGLLTIGRSNPTDCNQPDVRPGQTLYECDGVLLTSLFGSQMTCPHDKGSSSSRRGGSGRASSQSQSVDATSQQQGQGGSSQQQGGGDSLTLQQKAYLAALQQQQQATGVGGGQFSQEQLAQLTAAMQQQQATGMGGGQFSQEQLAQLTAAMQQQQQQTAAAALPPLQNVSWYKNEPTDRTWTGWSNGDCEIGTDKYCTCSHKYKAATREGANGVEAFCVNEDNRNDTHAMVCPTGTRPVAWKQSAGGGWEGFTCVAD